MVPENVSQQKRLECFRAAAKNTHTQNTYTLTLPLPLPPSSFLASFSELQCNASFMIAFFSCRKYSIAPPHFSRFSDVGCCKSCLQAIVCGVTLIKCLWQWMCLYRQTLILNHILSFIFFMPPLPLGQKEKQKTKLKTYTEQSLASEILPMQLFLPPPSSFSQQSNSAGWSTYQSSNPIWRNTGGDNIWLANPITH